MYAVVTNCTYDGLCVDVARAERLLGGSVDRVHFGAWGAWLGWMDLVGASCCECVGSDPVQT